MNPETKKYIAIAVLGVVLVGVVIYQVTRGGATARAAKEQAADAAKEVTAKASAAAKPKAQTGKASGNAESEKADVDIPTLLSKVQSCEFDYETNRVARDPMAPLVGPGAGGGPVPPEPGQDRRYINAILERVVSGIVWDAASPCAVVDDEIVFRGSEISVDTVPEPIIVVDIGPDSVTFRGGEVKLPVRLKE